jgi:hypothetical protein
MQKGNCSLCGIFCDLTFEHVPPRSAFNKKTRYKAIPYEQVLKTDNILDAKFKGKIEQGGLGHYSLCSNCNSFLGLKYVNAYSAYSNSFIEFAKKEQFNYFEFTMHDFEAAKVLKQITSMFISLNNWQFSEANPEMREYVLNPENQDLPNKFRIFSYLKTEGDLRNSRISAIGDLKTSKTIVGTEIAFPPLGHLMTIDFEGTLPYHFELTNFKNYSINELVSVDFKIYRLPTYLPFLLDYRQKEEIEKTIEESNRMRPT